MKEHKTVEFYGSMAGSIVAMVLFNIALPLRGWTFGVILPSWADVLWAMNISFAAQILGNLLLATYRPSWFYELIQTLIAGTGLLAAIVFYLVFPLDFTPLVGDWLNTLLRVIMVIAIGATAISLILHLVRFIVASVEGEYDAADGAR